MTDTTPNFDPIPRLQQIAATIEESGADIFDAPATAVHYIECAIKEIERLRKERDEAMRLSCISFEDIIALATTGIASAPRHKYHEHANGRGWDCFKENQ